MIYDEEFADLVSEGAAGGSASSPGSEPAAPARRIRCSSELIARGDDSELAPPAEKGRVVILTSGTTGTPKGAARKQPDSLEPAAALFSKIPLKARETTMIAAPMFHSWGFAHFTLAPAAGLDARAAPQVRPRGDAAGRSPSTARARSCVVPVMLQRILELGAGDDRALRRQLR